MKKTLLLLTILFLSLSTAYGFGFKRQQNTFIISGKRVELTVKDAVVDAVRNRS